MTYLAVVSFFLVYKFSQSQLIPYITGGEFAQYKQYPHSVFLYIKCDERYVCGGSVLNQDIVLTAAHCMVGCTDLVNGTIVLKYGHEELKKMLKTKVLDYIVHEEFSEVLSGNDIALVLPTERIPLNDVIKRVILMKSPPAATFAYVAGWGMDENQELQVTLKHTEQLIRNEEVCQNMVYVPQRTFCAGPLKGLGAADQGDSGGALVINGYIQIGIVSFKITAYSLVTYTNVSCYLEWINNSAMELLCEE